MDVRSSSPLTRQAIALAETKVSGLKGRRAELDPKVGLLVTANERDSRVAVVHGCFSEGDDSILSTFSWEPLRAKLQDK